MISKKKVEEVWTPTQKIALLQLVGNAETFYKDIMRDQLQDY